MLSAAERQGSRRGSWKTSPIRGSGPSIGRPSRSAAPVAGREQAGDDPQQRGLAAAVRADQGDDPAIGDRRGRCRSRTGSGGPATGREGERQIVDADGAACRCRSAVPLTTGPRASGRRIGRGRRIELAVRLEQPVVDRRELASRLDPLGDVGHRRDRGRQVRLRARPDGRHDRRTERRRSRARPARATGKPVTSALTAFQNALRAGPPQTRIAVTWTPAASIGVATWRMASADASTIARAMCPRPCAEGQPGEDAARVGVPDRRALAGEIRQEDEAVGAGRRARSLGEQGVGRDRAAEDRVAVPVERPARGGHRRADAEPPGQRRRRHERARRRRAAGPSRRRTRRPTRPGSYASPGSRSPAPMVARERVDRPPDDRDAGAQAERVGGGGGQPADDLAHRRQRRQPVERQPGGRDEPPIRRRPRRARVTWPRPRSGAAPATPRSRGTSGSRRRRRARAARPTARPAVRRATSRGPRSRRRARRPPPTARVSRKVIAGRVASPRASTATRVGPWPSTPIATTSVVSETWSARTAPTTADHHAPGSCSAQPRPAETSSA